MAWEIKEEIMLPITCKGCYYQKYKTKKDKKGKNQKIPICTLPKNKYCPGD